MNAVFRHELKRYFVSPAGYAFLILYTLMAGVIYVFVNIGQESSASMNLTLSGMQLPLMLAAPLLTMRLFAEERRMRTGCCLLRLCHWAGWCWAKCWPQRRCWRWPWG